jgi:hypothetical protein
MTTLALGSPCSECWPDQGIPVSGGWLEFLFVIRNVNEFVAAFSERWLKIQPHEGAMDPESCSDCGGTGYVAKPVDINGKSEGIAFIRLKCPACAGSGRKRATPTNPAG